MNNLVVRSISGVGLVALLTFCILWHPITYGVLFCIIILTMQYEYITINGAAKNNLFGEFCSIIAGLALFITTFLVEGYGAPTKIIAISIIPIIALFIGSLYVKRYNNHSENNSENNYNSFPFLSTSILYIALPFTLINFICFSANGIYSGKILMSLMILLWCTDVGAYCLGSTIGQRYGKKLFPSISPKKSWYGFFGGVISAIIASILLSYFNLLEIQLIHCIILSILISIFTVLGDLVESQFKRNFAVKDSGHIIPGHGGMLDRFDGALIAFPIGIIYLILFVL